MTAPTRTTINVQPPPLYQELRPSSTGGATAQPPRLIPKRGRVLKGILKMAFPCLHSNQRRRRSRASDVHPTSAQLAFMRSFTSRAFLLLQFIQSFLLFGKMVVNYMSRWLHLVNEGSSFGMLLFCLFILFSQSLSSSLSEISMNST